MKREIIGILVCSLLIATAFLLAAGTGNTRLVDRSNPAHPTDRGPGDSDNLNIHRDLTLSSHGSKNVNIHRGGSTGSKDAIIWDNGGPTTPYNVYSSQLDTCYPFVSQVADDFIFDEDMSVTDVHWWGRFWNGPPDSVDPLNFRIYFYADDGTGNAPTGGGMPDPAPTALAYYYFPRVSGLPLDANGFYEYDVNLSPPFSAAANVKYWIAIQADFCFEPQWGWAATGGIQLHSAVQGMPLIDTDFWTTIDPMSDVAFYLTGKPEEEPWPNHKMHFPQLPDLEGWDVNATYPKILADDWQCSQSGSVEDIHFWGSWKDLDGAPWTDDFPPWGHMPYFSLSIHRNIPADFDTPWSRPGELLWEWEGEIPGIPYEPPAIEHWFDPNTGEYFCNDHIPYWRYDFFFDEAYPPADSFYQDKDSIYWLNITYFPYEPEPPCQWGWKSSRDHFMDDAAYTDDDPFPPWYPMIEPPRCNWFDVYFDSLGEPEDMQSTNYYGSGWYKYEYWWNMWFYDNPFTYERPKYISLDFYIDPVGPEPFAQFAINWSTDLWSLEGVPGRPPLPGEDEELYIGRQNFEVFPGWNYIGYEIPYYNPEWVSIDFVAQDVIINGWIWHECNPTSMDLAFVITGGEERAKFIRGDYDANGVLAMPDALGLLLYKYHQPGGVAPPCEDAGDYDDSGELAMPDALALLLYKYHQPGGVPPPPPYPDCGIDPTDDGLGCDSYPPCGTKVAKPLISSASASVENASNVVKVGEGYLAEDGLVIVPVELTNEAELRGFEFTVNFDPALLTATKAGGGDGYDFFAPWIDNEAGKVTIACVPDLSMHKPFTPGQRVVAEISFQPKGNASLSLSDVALYGLRAEVVDALWIDGTVKAGIGLPMQFALQQNYPNPFNAITEIKYALPKDCLVRLEVYNVVGQRVATLVDAKQKAGYRIAKWDANSLSSGIYFYRLQAGDFMQTRKMVLLK